MHRDALIVAVSNILTSFFAGLVIFSIIGFLAHELNVNVDKVVDQVSTRVPFNYTFYRISINMAKLMMIPGSWFGIYCLPRSGYKASGITTLVVAFFRHVTYTWIRLTSMSRRMKIYTLRR